MNRDSSLGRVTILLVCGLMVTTCLGVRAELSSSKLYDTKIVRVFVGDREYMNNLRHRKYHGG